MKLHPLFTQGQWHRLVKETFDSPSGLNPADVGSVILALAVTGRHTEAESLLKKAEGAHSQISEEEKSAAYFYLAISWTRQSEYKRAKSLFLKNWRQRKTLSPVGRFFAYQGAAFYAYFLGDYQRALKNSHRALQLAVDASFTYGRAIATDLWAHSQIKSGFIQEGMHKLEEAMDLFSTLDNTSIGSACEGALFLYRAEYGYEKESTLLKLRQKISDVQIEDTYTQVNLTLELVRQLTLRAQWAEAESALTDVSRILYRHRNRRQEIIFHLRRAELEYQKGQSSQAWSSLRAAELCMHTEADRDFRRKFLGLSMKVFRSLQQPELADSCQAELLALDPEQSSRINQNILSRYGIAPSRLSRTDDIIGSYLDQVQRDPLAAFNHVVLTEGFFSLLYEIHEFRRGKAMMIYISQSKRVLLVQPNLGIHLTAPLTDLHARVLLTLLQREHSKEELIQLVWGYDYETLRHDSLIYAAIGGLRKAFGLCSEWLQNTENGYVLLPEARKYVSDLQGLKEVALNGMAFAGMTRPLNGTFSSNLNGTFRSNGNGADDSPMPSLLAKTHLGPNETAANSSQGKSPPAPGWSKALRDLNARQIALFGYFEKEAYMNVHEYQNIFKVSEVTACRDLSALFKKGLLQRIGKARATRYCLPKTIPAKFLSKPQDSWET